MTDEQFYVLTDVRDVPTAADLQVPRAVALLDAVRRQNDYHLVQLLRRDREGVLSYECLVVDVDCEGVPPKNPYGIRYRERIALCVPADAGQLVQVLTLRREFPTLMHEYATPVDQPASLCLYFEPPRAVLRTWTPQKFLRRVQWWLEQSARGELHAADQPVEQLFYVTNYELVLPWDFDELKQRVGQRFVVALRVTRPGGGQTYLVLPADERDGRQNATTAPIDITLPAVVQGPIERDPATLGELADALLQRGVDVLTVLQQAIEARVDEGGATERDDDSFSVILIHVPILRTEGGEIERTVHRGFFVDLGPLRLGVRTGALLSHEGKYYRASGVLGGLQNDSWRACRISAMEVLRFNNAAMARAQSGVADPGPTAAMVGVGSLGSAMLHLWGRSGWGRWTAIDTDHVRPHNLARHVAYASQVGSPKSEAVSQLHDALMQGATRVQSLVADATNFRDPRIIDALNSAALVIDASTTLEYPRMVSTREGVGRHMSVFVTPNGQGAVLLVEDRERLARLRTLESQYYRAVIEESWGEHHLAGIFGSFWSGASCRDISTVMPYSSIVLHAAALVEQVQRAASRPEASIGVWVHDADEGATAVHRPPAFRELAIPFDGMTVFVDEGIERKMRALRAARAPAETGGILIGYHDLNVNAIVIVDALPEPVDSRGSESSFERGVEGLAAAVAEASRRTAGIVGYIGEWHSHPPGHSSNPSGADVYQLVYLAQGMAEDGLPAVSLVVGESDFAVLGAAARR